MYPVLPHTHRCAYIQKETENPPGFQTFLVTLESKKVMKIVSLEAKVKVWHPFGNLEALGDEEVVLDYFRSKN